MSVQEPGARSQEPGVGNSEFRVGNSESSILDLANSPALKRRELADAVVRIEQVSKIFDANGTSFQALDTVSCEIQRGEMVAIMGPSGSGKSTLMNIIGLLDVPSSGNYWLDGEDVSQLDRKRQAQVRNTKIGFIFQSFNLLPRLSAQRNVELPLVYARIGTRERQERAQAALEAVGLGDKRDNLPNQLSGGQKQRVAVARALVTQPSMLLADEPTGALDTKTGTEILALFRQLNREQGVTLVVITHDAEVGKQMDRVIGLRDGKLVDRILETYYHQGEEFRIQNPESRSNAYA